MPARLNLKTVDPLLIIVPTLLSLLDLKCFMLRLVFMLTLLQFYPNSTRGNIDAHW